MRRITVRLLALIVIVGGSGCSTVGYYAQLADGHLSLLAAREPIDELLSGQSTPEALKGRLRVSQAVRDYASEELLLPDNGSYRSYADLGRDTVTWNVVATPEYSLKPRRWCFWVAGCVAYRGYYSRKSAEVFVDSLGEEHLDIAIIGSTAYSTLGWFDDPLLNTMIAGEDFTIAGLIFHELAHQKVYVGDSSEFNEAFATFVEQQGVREWLESRRDRDGFRRYQLRLARQREFLALLANTREHLLDLYSGERGSIELEEEKQQIFARLRNNYAMLKVDWDGYTGYDAWFDQPLNNAYLASVSTYFRWVPAFERLYRQVGCWQAFYDEVSGLASLSSTHRRKRLESLLKRG